MPPPPLENDEEVVFKTALELSKLEEFRYWTGLLDLIHATMKEPMSRSSGRCRLHYMAAVSREIIVRLPRTGACADVVHRRRALGLRGHPVHGGDAVGVHGAPPQLGATTSTAAGNSP